MRTGEITWLPMHAGSRKACACNKFERLGLVKFLISALERWIINTLALSQVPPSPVCVNPARSSANKMSPFLFSFLQSFLDLDKLMDFIYLGHIAIKDQILWNRVNVVRLDTCLHIEDSLDTEDCLWAFWKCQGGLIKDGCLAKIPREPELYILLFISDCLIFPRKWCQDMLMYYMHQQLRWEGQVIVA